MIATQLQTVEPFLTLLTKQTIEEYNYYTLYIDNPTVPLIGRAWNRVVFCLFGSLGWFLGKAGSRDNEITRGAQVDALDDYKSAKRALAGCEKMEELGSCVARCLAAGHARLNQLKSFSYKCEALRPNLGKYNATLIGVIYFDILQTLQASHADAIEQAKKCEVFMNDMFEYGRTGVLPF